MSTSVNSPSADKSQAQGTSSTPAPPTDTPTFSRNKPNHIPLSTGARNTSLLGNRRKTGTITTTMA